MLKKDLIDFPNYQVYEDGRVYSKVSKKFLKPFPISRPNKEGVKEYLAVKLCNHGIEKTIQLHRLVALTFIENPEQKEQVNHKDGNKANNEVSNLEWVTHTENIRHAFATKLNSGTKWAGCKHSRASFTEEEVRDICDKFQKGLSVKDITGCLDNSEALNLYNKLYRIYKRDNWTSISKEYNW